MKSILVAALLAAGIPAAAESLTYNINWASGLSAGEATLSSTKSTDTARAWSLDLNLDASVPGFTVKDHYHSTANAEMCSVRLDKDTSRGLRKTKETDTFDQEKHQLKRETEGGGHSEVSTGMCARDALAFLQFVRKELEQGRLAPRQAVTFGAEYQVRFDYTGVQRIKSGEKSIEAERIQATIKGPSTDVTCEIFFSRDAARTPVLARIPLSVGTLTLELVR
jgi:hypothetical protein